VGNCSVLTVLFCTVAVACNSGITNKQRPLFMIKTTYSALFVCMGSIGRSPVAPALEWRTVQLGGAVPMPTTRRGLTVRCEIQTGCPTGPACPAPRQRKESFTAGSFPVAQFDSSQKPFVAYGNVPNSDIARIGQCAEKRTSKDLSVCECICVFKTQT